MPQTFPAQKRSRNSKRPTVGFGGHADTDAPICLWFRKATDACFWATMVAVSLCFGGRSAVGQLALVIGTAATTICWVIYLMTSRKPKYTWTGSEWVWLLGIGVGVAQIAPLPSDWMRIISPQTEEILPLWFDKDASGIFRNGWHQLSLAPWETASGLITFTAYAILFLVAVQRSETVADVAIQLRGVVVVTLAMSVFALIQYFASNGKFFWFIHHPFMSTDGTPHGSFTNHNHLSQFLALGVAPILWWILCPRDLERDSNFNDSPQRSNHVAGWALTLGLAVLSLTVLLTASRGGVLALGLATIVSLTFFCRFGLVSASFVVGLFCIGTVSAVIFFFTGYEVLAGRLDLTADGGTKATGRMEIWQANLDVARDFPLFGTGVGTHEDSHILHLDAENSDTNVYTHAECGYLQVASETGLAGLSVMLLMILTSTWWCLIALRNSDVQVRTAAAAIFASLVANLCHAVGDFFWYTPACMLLLAVQLAAVCRLSALTRQADGRIVRTLSLPRPLTFIAGGAMAVTTIFMVHQKLPAALADPDLLCFLTHTRLDDEDRLEQKDEEQRAVIRAARLNPYNSQLQENAALAYMEMFDARQAKNPENQMTHAEIRDSVRDMEFKNDQALQDWLHRAFDPNLKLLRISKKYFQKALQASPLRVDSYINLLEIGFLDRSTAKREMKYLNQVRRIRPYDAHVLFAVGLHTMLIEKTNDGLKYWREAYHRSPRLREKITKYIVEHVDDEEFNAEMFIESFRPDWRAMHSLAQTYETFKKPDQSRIVWEKCIEEGKRRRKTNLTTVDRESIMLLIRDGYFGLNQPDQGIRVLMEAQKEDPYDLVIRARLGWDLYEAGRLSEAAEHLKWCAARSPNDIPLQQAAARAIKERLKTTASRSSSNPT